MNPPPEQPLPEISQVKLPKNQQSSKVCPLQVPSGCNLRWLTSASRGSTNLNREHPKKAKLVSKSNRFSQPQEKNPKSSKLLLSHSSISLTNTNSRLLQHPKEEKAEKGQYENLQLQSATLPNRAMNESLVPPLSNPSTHLLKRKRSKSPIYPGSSKINSLDLNCAPSCEPLLDSFRPGWLTRNKSERVSLTRPDIQPSWIQSGLISSREKQLTSTTSSPDSTLHRPIISAPKVSEKLSLNLEQKTPQSQLPRTEIGQLRSISREMPTSSPSPTELKSLKYIKDTSFSNSHPNGSQNTFASLLSTKPLENEFQSDVTCSYPTLSSSATSAPCTSTISGPLNPLDCPDLVRRHHQTDHPFGSVTKPAITGTKEYAGEEKTAFTSTSASCVLRRDIPVTSARRKALQEVLELKARRPG